MVNLLCLKSVIRSEQSSRVNQQGSQQFQEFLQKEEMEVDNCESLPVDNKLGDQTPSPLQSENAAASQDEYNDEAFLECPQLNEQSQSSYEDDKDFESLSDGQIEADQNHVRLREPMQTEPISPKVVIGSPDVSELDVTSDAMMKSSISQDAQKPHVALTPKQLTKENNRNILEANHTKRGTERSQEAKRRDPVSTFSKCPEPRAVPNQISQPSLLPSFKQQNTQKKPVTKKFEKSQQAVRKSYSRFVTAQHHGHNSQRPSHPPFITSTGIADGQVYAQQTAQTHVISGTALARRTLGRGTKVGTRSKTVKPSDLVGSASHFKSNSGQANLQQASVAGPGNLKTKQVDLLVIGAGPASLGLLVAAVKQQRLSELIQDDGVAILDDGMAFGGGMLCNYGINSNTSANSFLKCIFRKQKDKDKLMMPLVAAATKASEAKTQLQSSTKVSAKEQSNKVKRRQKSVCKDRVSQHQLKMLPEPQTTKQRNRQMSPVATTTSTAAKWMNNRTATSQPPSKLESIKQVVPQQDETDNVVADPDPQGEVEIGQPQEPDQIKDEALGPLTAEVQSIAEELLPKNADIIVDHTDSVDESLQVTALQDDSKKQNGRKKSKDESSQPRTSFHHKKASAQPVLKQADKSIVLLNRVQSRTVAGIKNQSSKLSQNPLSNQAPITSSKTKGSKPVDPQKSKEWTSDDVLTPFKDIFPSNISVLFRKLSKSIVPLSLVGHLLNYVGNHLLQYCYQNTGKRIYYPRHRAISVHLMGNGDIVTQVLKTEFTIVPDPTSTPPSFSVVEGQQSVVHFRSKALVIAGGAKQGIDKRVTTEWFPNLNPDRLIPSDSFLKKEVYLQKVAQLAQIKDRPPKVVIIGGSHSGFSCAWLLLNGPAMYQNCFKTLGTEASQKVPYANRKQIKNCIPCCTCGNAVAIASAKLAAQKESGSMQNQRYLEDLRSQSKNGSRAPRGLSIAARELSPVNKNSRQLSKTTKQRKDLANLKADTANQGMMSPDLKRAASKAQESAVAENLCTCLCKCFGYFRYNEWVNEGTSPLQLPQFEDASIKILYRDRIKVFFKTTKDAEEAGYKDFDAQERQYMKKKKDGYVHSFTGLRGDAKQLYQDVTNGKEKRVTFVKAETPELQKPYVDDADLVIWACGYQSNAIKIFDLNKKELQLSQKMPNTQFDVDGKNRVMLADGNVLNKVFACGVGFPVRTKDGGVGNVDSSKNPRADSFSLYMHTVGELLLKSLLPKRKIAAIVSHKEAANPYLKAATYEQIIKDKDRKNQKISIKEMSTKKEKGSISKLSQLANPNGYRVPPVKGLVFDQLTQNQQEVYVSYLKKNGQQLFGTQAKQRNGAIALNTDLEQLSGFDHVHSMASKSNCFSQRNDIHLPIEQVLQNTGYSDNQASSRRAPADPITLYSNDLIQQPLGVHFPDIRAEQPYQFESKLLIKQDDQKSLTQLVPNDIHIPDKPTNQTLPDEDLDLNERESSHILSQPQLLQTSTVESQQPTANLGQQKSVERVMTSNSRNSQGLASQIPSKSPLLLQKKQQMVTQKTREPVLPNSYAPTQIATMSNLKPMHASKTASKAKKQQKRNTQAVIDQASPYLHFGVPAPSTEKKPTQKQLASAKRMNAKSSKEATSVLKDTSSVTHKDKSLTVSQVPTSAILSKQSTLTSASKNQTKEVISSSIQQTQKLFSEREQSHGLRFKQLQNLQNSAAAPVKKTKREGHLKSIDLSAESHALKFQQQVFDQKKDDPSQSIAVTEPAQKIHLDYDSIVRDKTVLLENAYSVKSLISNSELFPPIQNKQTTAIVATEWANNSLQNSHSRRKPSNQSAIAKQSDSIQSLLPTAQVSASGQPKPQLKDKSVRKSEDSITQLVKQNSGGPSTILLGNAPAEGKTNRSKMIKGFLEARQKNPVTLLGQGQSTKVTSRSKQLASKKPGVEETTNDRSTVVQKITEDAGVVQVKNFEAAKQLLPVTVHSTGGPSPILTSQPDQTQPDQDDDYADDKFLQDTNKVAVEEEAPAFNVGLDSSTPVEPRTLTAQGHDEEQQHLAPSNSGFLRMKDGPPPQKSGEQSLIKDKKKPKNDTLVKKFESVINQKSTKLAPDVTNQDDLHKSSTPNRLASKKLEAQIGTGTSTTTKGRPRISDMSAVLSARRTGTFSSTDIIPNHTASKRTSAHKATAKQMNSVGLIDKILNGKEIYPILPESLQPLQQNSLNSAKQVTKKIAQTISNGGSNRMSLRQRQVVESQNAKFKQLVHMTGEKPAKQSREKADDNKLVKSQSKPITSLTKQTQMQSSPQPFSLPIHRKASETPVVESKLQTTNQQQSLGYSRSNQQTSFFVHKTINELTIKPDHDHTTSIEKREPSVEDLHKEASISQLHPKIKAVKREVQARAAHLSPVLKNRGQSKASLSTSKAHGLMSSSNQTANMKHKSPLRTTSKATQPSKDAKPGFNQGLGQAKARLRSPKTTNRNYMLMGSSAHQADIINKISDLSAASQNHKRKASNNRGISNSASQSALSIHASQVVLKKEPTAAGRNGSRKQTQQ